MAKIFLQTCEFLFKVNGTNFKITFSINPVTTGYLAHGCWENDG